MRRHKGHGGRCPGPCDKHCGCPKPCPPAPTPGSSCICPPGPPGPQGPRGFTGPPGSTTPFGGGPALLQFSGQVAASLLGAIAVTYYADAGLASPAQGSIAYPVSEAFTIDTLYTNLQNVIVPIPVGASVTFELLRNGAGTGLITEYTDGQSGIESDTSAPITFAVGDTYGLRSESTGIIALVLNLTATAS